MGDVHGVYSWAVRTYECGPGGVATMASVCNWLQEAASLNAETLSFSKSNFEAAGENISWVLTRLKVRILRFPKWEETVSILTFPRGGRRIVAYRDFVLTGADGAELGCATSEWMLIDLASRKVVAIPDGEYGPETGVRRRAVREAALGLQRGVSGRSVVSRQARRHRPERTRKQRPLRRMADGRSSRCGGSVPRARHRVQVGNACGRRGACRIRGDGAGRVLPSRLCARRTRPCLGENLFIAFV